MGAEKNLKTAANDRLGKSHRLERKKKKKKGSKEENNEKKISKLVESGDNLSEVTEEKRKNKSSGKKRRKRENGNKVDAKEVDLSNIEEDKMEEADGAEKKFKLLRRKKRKSDKITEAEVANVDELNNEVEDDFDEQKDGNEARIKKTSKSKKKKCKTRKMKISEIDKVDEFVEDGSNQWNGKSNKASQTKSKDHISSEENEKLLVKSEEAEEDEVFQISSGDEDCSRGMKKWITDYHQSRPGLKVLQQKIDDFITAHEAQEEQARKEREARVADDGWTVVVHHKGRKKTTDSESGIAVGSVAPAAVMDKMAKKKSKEVGLDFYRFQKREAQRNEIMMLQSKFEQDRKRIQQLRAARKFRPY